MRKGQQRVPGAMTPPPAEGPVAQTGGVTLTLSAEVDLVYLREALVQARYAISEFGKTTDWICEILQELINECDKQDG